MPSERVSMYRIREVLRLSAAGLTVRQVAAGARLSVGAVSKYLNAARASGVAWPVPQEWDDAELERRVYGEAACRPSKFVMPACAAMHQELKRHRHVTLQLLWEEYRAEHGPAAYSYSEFCTHYRRWKRQSARSMRQRHIAGEKLFIDYAGTQVPIYGAHDEPVLWASVFVAVWGVSNYTYAEATRTQSLPDWLGSHVRALTACGGAPAIFVPDNPKVGVTKADRYEPILQRSYDELARHYGAVVIPARPFRPRDKPKVEQGVLLVSRWVLARLRHQRFFSLDELNTAIAALMVELNERPFKRLPGNRRAAFETLDRPAMKPLPARRTNTRSGSEPRSASITTSRSSGTTTASRTPSSATRSRPASAPVPSSASSMPAASPSTPAATKSASTRRSRSTCRNRIRSTPSGVQRG